jgi:hypothetical protein
MKYPFWLPKPRRHWLRAIELLFLSIPVVFLLRLSAYAIAINPVTILEGKISSLGVIAWLGLFFLFPPYFFAHTYQFLHDNPRDDFPDWFPRWRCLINGWGYWLIFLSAMYISFLAWIDYEVVNDTAFITREEYVEEVLPLITVTWVISAAYLFYLKDGIKWFCQELVKLAFALVGKKR